MNKMDSEVLEVSGLLREVKTGITYLHGNSVVTNPHMGRFGP